MCLKIVFERVPTNEAVGYKEVVICQRDDILVPITSVLGVLIPAILSPPNEVGTAPIGWHVFPQRPDAIGRFGGNSIIPVTTIYPIAKGLDRGLETHVALYMGYHYIEGKNIVWTTSSSLIDFQEKSINSGEGCLFAAKTCAQFKIASLNSLKPGVLVFANEKVCKKHQFLPLTPVHFEKYIYLQRGAHNVF